VIGAVPLVALLDEVYIFDVPDRGLGYVSGHSAVAVALAMVSSPFLGRRACRVAWVLAALVCVARIYVGSHLPLDVVGGAVAQVEHEASMGLLAAAGGVQAPPVLLVGSFGNGAGLLVQQQVAGRDLTELGDGRLDDAMLADVWRQVARLRAARIAHGDLGLASVLLDEQGKAWLVDFDHAEAAASDALLDRDLGTLLAALGRAADPARVRVTAEQNLGEELPQRSRRSVDPRNAGPPT
jgi:predicted Ser/Thr protein kinase